MGAFQEHGIIFQSMDQVKRYNGLWREKNKTKSMQEACYLIEGSNYDLERNDSRNHSSPYVV